MACKHCNFIADEIQCQGCADDIIDDCDNGHCVYENSGMLESYNGHHIDWKKSSESEDL